MISIWRSGVVEKSNHLRPIYLENHNTPVKFMSLTPPPIAHRSLAILVVSHTLGFF
jgi:hypothetical protein